MFDQVLVPVDGSPESARALRPASAVAHYLGVMMHIVAYHSPNDDGFDLTQLVQRQSREIGDVHRKIDVEPMTDTVDVLVGAKLEQAPGALVVMSTRGQGRSAGLIGSVANEVLARTHRPIMLIGPQCDVGRFRLHGKLVVATDASPGTSPALELAKELLETFDHEPVVVNVIDPATERALSRARSGPTGYDIVPDSAMAHRYAQDLGWSTDRAEIDYQVLHDKHPGRAVAEFAGESGAVLVCMATHARSGLRRFALGSVTADVVANAPCPVLAIAPAEISQSP